MSHLKTAYNLGYLAAMEKNAGGGSSRLFSEMGGNVGGKLDDLAAFIARKAGDLPHNARLAKGRAGDLASRVIPGMRRLPGEVHYPAGVHNPSAPNQGRILDRFLGRSRNDVGSAASRHMDGTMRGDQGYFNEVMREYDLGKNILRGGAGLGALGIGGLGTAAALSGDE